MQNKKWMCKLHIHFFCFSCFVYRTIYFTNSYIEEQGNKIKNPERMVWFAAENRVEVHKNDEKCENVFVRDGESRKLDRILHRKYCSFFFFFYA